MPDIRLYTMVLACVVVGNTASPSMSVTGWDIMYFDVEQFGDDSSLGWNMPRPAMFIGREMIYHISSWTLTTPKVEGVKDLERAQYKGGEFNLDGTRPWIYSHSCWSKWMIPEKKACGGLTEILNKMSMEFIQISTFFWCSFQHHHLCPEKLPYI